MAKTKVPKNLEVDGTPKLAARAKPSDKHEKPDLTIEEATVASPRASRARAGDYFDFDGDESEAEHTTQHKGARAEKPKRKSRATVTKDDDKSDKTNAVPAEKGKKAAKPKASKADDAAQEKPMNEKKQKAPKASKEAAASKANSVKKSTAAPEVDEDMDESSTLAPHLAMDESPFEKLESEKEKAPKSSRKESAGAAKAPKDTKEAAKEPKTSKSKSTTSTPAEVADEVRKQAKIGTEKVKKATKSKVPTGETATSVADATKEKAKVGTEKTKRAAKGKAPSIETAAESADGVKEAAKAGAEKIKKTVKAKIPTGESVAESTGTAKDAVKAGTAKAKKAAKANAPSTEAITELADVAKDTAKTGSARAKKATKAKVPSAESISETTDTAKETVKVGAAKAKKAVKDNAPDADAMVDTADAAKEQVKAGADKVKEVVKAKAPSAKTAADAADTVKKGAKSAADKAKKATQSIDSDKLEAQNSKKRKAPPSGDAETVKRDLLDPLSEHAGESVSKKQKKQKSKSLGGTVGEVLAEGANAIAGFANSLLGGATQVADDTVESAKTFTTEAKGKGKAIAENLAEISGKAAPETAAEDDEDESDAEPDDHTAAILAGFESEGDDATTSGPGFEKGQTIPELPEESATKLKGIKAGSNEGPGVVYVGRIPHGFYEHEMRQYFSQFGDINRLRLSRNKKTGASRHWAFVEFKSAEVSKIVAETMNNYLLFEHILKCAVVPQEQLHEDVWKGADKRFKSVPWNKMEGRKHEMAVGKEHWDGRISNEEKRRKSKKEKMKEIGYDFEAPELKGTADVADKTKGESVEEEKSLVTTGGEEGQTLVVSDEVKTKKSKKTSKGEQTTTTVTKKTKRALEAGQEAAGSATKKAKTAATKGSS
ncbi:nucleolar protein 15, partial [Lecanoromycetidae sp. Uapishka_2]